MKKDHNLDDLIIDDIRPSKGKGKGVLTVIALLIALLIIAIVMTRLFLGESDQNATTVGERQDELISPELRLDASDRNLEADKKELDQLSSMMEETLVSKKDTSSQDLTPQIKPDTAIIDETEKSIIAPDTQITEKRVAEEVVVQAPIEEIKPEVKKPAPEVQTPAPKTTPAPTAKPEPKKAPPKKAASSSSYYIQVGSFASKPSSRFLSTITKNGYHYELKKGKLLIGPYGSDAAARRDLSGVKSKINKSAFIKHF